MDHPELDKLIEVGVDLERRRTALIAQRFDLSTEINGLNRLMDLNQRAVSDYLNEIRKKKLAEPST